MKAEKIVSVVIPIYKKFESLSDSEKISWTQCLNILHRYDISLVYPQSLNVSEYVYDLFDKGNSYALQSFEDKYFKSTDSYNKLLLHKDFFNRFLKYEYILICQLDVFVFCDLVEDWCSKGYSYVGPPWFKGFIPEPDNAQLWRVGNGGFSLRRIADCLRVLNTFKLIFSWPTILKENFSSGLLYGFGKLPFMFKRIIFGNNTYHALNDYHSQEDVFWSVICNDRFAWYKVPNVTEALKFGFDYHPEIMYELNGKQLPMGFHGWDKHRNGFWKDIFARAGYFSK
jgi:hypothetical protein